MQDRPQFGKTPSVEEFRGWYNLGCDYGDGHPVLYSRADVPEYHQAEMLNLYFEFRDWFDSLVTPNRKMPFDPLERTPFFVRSDADDRTLDVDADFRYLSVAVLRRIQSEFLGRYPLWRVILIAEVPSCSIVIYPTAIRFGNLPVDVDPDLALRELVPKNEALKFERERPRREYVECVRPLIPKAVREIGDEPVVVCGILDNYEGDYSRLSIFLLIRGDDEDLVRIQDPPRVAEHFFWVSSRYGIDRTGAMISYIEIPPGAAYCLAPWLPPADYRGPLTITERDTGREHRFEVTDESIIRTAIRPSSIVEQP